MNRLFSWPWILLASIALLGPGCPDAETDDDATGDDDDADDDSSATGDDDSADGWGDPGAQAPPTLDALPSPVNVSYLDITGVAQEPGSLIRAYGIEVYTANADAGTGEFAVTVGVAPGDNTYQVTAELDGLESLPATTSTERCSPGDANEALGGDTCEEAIDLGWLPDIGTQMLVSGNAAEDGDEDWYSFVAGDDVNEDLTLMADDWSVSIQFTQNDADEFRIEVYRGSCEDLECPDMRVPYLEYTSTLDQTPCGEAPYNDCVDDTTRFHLRVYPLNEGSECGAYKLDIRNG